VPKYPENEYRCECGFETHKWSNLRAHHQGCDEHKDAVKNLEKQAAKAWGKQLPPEDRPPPTMYICPYCEDEKPGSYETSDFKLLEAHIESCYAKLQTKSMGKLVQAGARRIAQDLDKLAEFEKWCRDNGR